MSPGQGRVVGSRYETKQLLKGGSGIDTYLAEDLHGGRRVILKMTNVRTVSGAAQMRLEHEANILSRIAGPAFAPLLESGRHADMVYLVTPYIAGVTLASRLEAGPLSLLDALTVARGVLAGLDEAHGLGVLHRDVKPANVIVNEDGELKRATLIDFGLARSAHLDASIRDLAVGTARYISPEQAGLLEYDVDERSDLYSTGVLLFECLAGRPPFGGATVGEVLRQHLTAAPPDLRGLGVQVPRALDEVVQRLLRKDPRDRYQSAFAVLADLEEIAEALGRGVVEPPVVVGLHDRRRTLTGPAFVGRTDEIQRLESQLGLAEQGHRSLVFVEAESGAGKSRLLGEFAKLAAQRGFLVLEGQGIDQAASWPFQLLSGVVSGLIAVAETDRDLAEGIRQRLGDDRDAVIVAFPELEAILGPRTEATLGPEAYGEARSIRALGRLLDAFGSTADPALVILDDCQWGDTSTVRLLADWLGSGSGGNIVVIAAFRSEEVDASSPLRRIEPHVHLELPPLGPAEIQDLLESMAGTLPEVVVDTVVGLAEGSPFMAEAVLRGLVESETLLHTPHGWSVEPMALADVQSSRQAATFLTRRLERLPEQVQRLLCVGAVLGKTFDLALAAGLAGQSSQEAITAVDEARDRHLVWMPGHGERCVFVHDKLRETLLALLDVPERRRLHRLAGLELEAQQPTPVFEVAYHFDAAGEPERALPFALEAGERARARHSLEVAQKQYEIALRGAPVEDDDVRFRIAEGLGDVLMLRGSYREAGEQFERAEPLARSSRDRVRIAQKLSELAFKRGDLEASGRTAERALRELGQRVPRTKLGYLVWTVWEVLVQVVHTAFPRLSCGRRPIEDASEDLLGCRLYSRLAHVNWFERGPVQTLWAHLREMNLAERYPPTAELAQAYSEHAPVMTLIPWWARGVRYVERSLHIRTELGDLWGQGQSLNFYGVVLYCASRYGEALERSRQAAKLLERTGDRWELNIARIHIAFSLYRMGNLAEAIEEAKRTHASGLEIGDPQASGIGLEIWAKASGGRVPAQRMERELTRETRDAQLASEILQAEGVRLLGRGQAAEAAERFTQARERARSAGLSQEYVAPAGPWLASALREQAEATTSLAPKQRRALLRRARRAARSGTLVARRYRNNLPHALREAGLLDAIRGRKRRARRRIDAALVEAQRQGAQFEYAQTLLVRGQLGRAYGWPAAAEEIQAAREQLHELAAPIEIDDFDVEDPTAVDPETTLSLVDRFTTLLDAGRRIASALSPDSIHEAVREAALQLLRGDRCIVLRVHRMPNGIDLTTVSGEIDVRYSRTLARDAVDGGRPVVYNESASADSSESLELSGARSALCAPISVRGRVTACFYVSHGQVGGLFGPDEQRLASFVSTLAGAALENAENFAETQALARTLEQRVQERTSQLEKSNLALDRSLRRIQTAYDRERDVVRKLRELDELKSDFLSTVSHELRTPLTAIGGFAQTLVDRWEAIDDPRRTDFVRRIVANADELDTLIRELLDFSRLERGHLSIEPRPCNVSEAVSSAVERLGSVLERHRIEIAVPPGTSAMSDPSVCARALENLLTNAAKFSPVGTTIRVEAREVGGEMVVTVRDEGLGIPLEEQERIFERFYRIERGDHAKTGGTGIGLAIVKEFVESQGGRVWVESRPGEGSAFSFTLGRQGVVPQTTSEVAAPSS